MSCVIAPEGYTELKSTAEVSDEEKTYEIPVGTIITVSAEWFCCLKVLFFSATLRSIARQG